MSVRCGNHPRGSKVNHPTADDVRDCYAGRYNDEAQAKAEHEAEQRNERFWEERGAGEDDSIEREAWAREDMMRPALPTVQDWAKVKAHASEEMDRPTDLIAALEASVREKRYIDEQEAERAASVLDDITGSHGRDMASVAQVDYVMDLLAGHVWPDTLSRSDVENMERRQVSKLIDQLKVAPAKKGSRTVPMVEDYPDLVAARYALRDDDGIVRFYQLDVGKHRAFKGNLFVAQLFGSPGDYRKEPRRGAAARTILDRINKNPEEAMALFGKESGYCGKCHSPLTNAESLERGIGPICARKLGW